MLYPTIFNVCMTTAETLPATKRVSLYRELAEFCGDVALSHRFTQLADSVESANNSHRELALSFQQ